MFAYRIVSHTLEHINIWCLLSQSHKSLYMNACVCVCARVSCTVDSWMRFGCLARNKNTIVFAFIQICARTIRCQFHNLNMSWFSIESGGKKNRKYSIKSKCWENPGKMPMRWGFWIFLEKWPKMVADSVQVGPKFVLKAKRNWRKLNFVRKIEPSKVPLFYNHRGPPVPEQSH